MFGILKRSLLGARDKCHSIIFFQENLLWSVSCNIYAHKHSKHNIYAHKHNIYAHKHCSKLFLLETKSNAFS